MTEGFLEFDDLPPEVRDVLKNLAPLEGLEVTPGPQVLSKDYGTLAGIQDTPITFPAPPPGLGEAISRNHKERRMRQLLQRLQHIKMESLRLYEPMAHIDVFHQCRAPERILRGSNRGGKTLGAAVEFARALTGQDPYGKYPVRDGRAFVVGKDGKHNSEVLYRKLFRAGAFRIIRDLKTGRWRALRPWDPDDKDREKESKPAPPLIPPRYIQDIAWENKREMLPNMVRLTTGWEVRFFSSLGKPPQGSDVDLVWFDEEIVDPEWYSEVAARGTLDRSGKFFWSATAQKGGEQLYEMCMQAEELRGTENPRVVEVFAHIDNNPYFTTAQKDLFFDKLSEEQRRIRIDGEFAFTSFRVYPEFDLGIHGVDPFPIPANWTRYMVVDPGRQVCAVLFGAVPPPDDKEHGRFVYLYAERYIRQSNAQKFATGVKGEVEGHAFRAFLIDHHGGRVTESGSGKTVERQYSEALKENNLSSDTTGTGFIWGSDNVEGGIEEVRNWMMIRPDGTPKMQVFRGTLPNFEHEISRYSYQRKGDLVTDKPLQKNNHLMDCLRYLALYDPQWHPHIKRARRKNPVLERLKQKQMKQAREAGAGYIRLGPGAKQRSDDF